MPNLPVRTHTGLKLPDGLWSLFGPGQQIDEPVKQRRIMANGFLIISIGKSVCGRSHEIAKFATDVTDHVENVERLADCLISLDEGDLSQTIEILFISWLERLRTDFNLASDKLKRAMAKVAEDARAITAGLNEMRNAADDLAKRTEQQAASV